MADDLLERLKVRAVEDETSVSALLVRGAEMVLGETSAALPTVELPALPAGVVALRARPGQMVITLPAEVMKLIPGDDKVAVVEAHLIERFGYGMYRVKQLLRPDERKKGAPE